MIYTHHRTTVAITIGDAYVLAPDCSALRLAVGSEADVVVSDKRVASIVPVRYRQAAVCEGERVRESV